MYKILSSGPRFANPNLRCCRSDMSSAFIFCPPFSRYLISIKHSPSGSAIRSLSISLSGTSRTSEAVRPFFSTVPLGQLTLISEFANLYKPSFIRYSISGFDILARRMRSPSPASFFSASNSSGARMPIPSRISFRFPGKIFVYPRSLPATSLWNPSTVTA